ncbi:MAG: enoyl-CoA hydratase/isomerase family protein [Dehalococcoidia bacterium]|nr:MAG: enoyl-CoA hydratase/isomerase family protein [Dehalococcoidia bacterium]
MSDRHRQSRSAAKYETILFKAKDHVATITMNRPDKLNACNIKMFQEIDHALALVEGDEDIKVVIITGAGDQSFSAGVDFDELEFKDLSESTEFIRTDARMFRRIENIPQPVIAAVNGYAYGYGCKIAVVSDIAIASESARFGLQGVKLGAVHVITLGRGRDVLSRGRLGYLLLSGETIDAQKAEDWGIVARVVTQDKLMPEVEALARSIASYPIVAVRTIKRMLHRGSDDDYRWEDLLSPGLLLMEDLKEGRKAFKEKRKPKFKGR